MKISRRLILRTIAGVGLTVSLTLFTLSATQLLAVSWWDWQVGSWTIIVDVDSWGLGLSWWSQAGLARPNVQLLQETDGMPKRLVPGFFVSVHSWQFVASRISHWLLCLTFLSATVATCVRWRRAPFASKDQDE